MTLRRVPWMHVFEWQQVCCDLFSIKLEDRCRGYEKLLLWKARQRDIPPGIECTLELVYVDLLDKNALANTSVGAFGEREMQMLMSSAIMRFLTHLSVLLGRDKSYQELATSLNLPHWLVQLRHHTAHEKDLPSLLLLRRGVNFCLEWLLKHYWQEANKPSNLNISNLHPVSCQDVYELLGAWESVSLYILRGFRTMDQVDSLHLKGVIHSIGKSNQQLSEICRNLLKKLFTTVKKRWHDKIICDKLSNLVLESETFIPMPELVEIMKTPNYFQKSGEENLVRNLVQVWKYVLKPLQEEYSLFPSLIHKLVTRQIALGDKHSTEQLIISQWIEVLCCSIIKTRAVSEKYQSTRRRKNELEDYEIEKRFDELNTEWRGGILAVPSMPSGNFCHRSLVKKACLKPNHFTSIFLGSLLMVAKPEFSNSEKSLIEKLVVLYTKGSNRKLLSSDRVHSTRELSLIAGTPLLGNFGIENEEYASQFQWSKCPLGTLPWSDVSLPSLDLPESVKWVERIALNYTSQEADTDLTLNSIEKNKVNSRKHKKGSVSKHTKKQNKLMAIQSGLRRKAESDSHGNR